MKSQFPRQVAVTLMVVFLPASCGRTTVTPLTKAEPQQDGPAEAVQSQQDDDADRNSRAVERQKNHLAGETSPYLLQHVHNPVDWYPWGPEALAKAKAENKPIFLSVGYSSCHWCHVMERESFMDREIAEYLNERFVPIKVDREERPDIDGIYMTALQIFNQVTGGARRGGWPMSIVLTPDGKPFFCGSYFPARDGDRGVSTGFLTLLQKIHAMWEMRPDAIREDAETLTRLVKQEMEEQIALTPVAIEPKLLDKSLADLAEQYDPQFAGFGYQEATPHIPKFPEPSNLYFLLDRARRSQDEQAEEMVHGTLERMTRGGIYDHLGGGFHRYSVDRYWRIPHFEKMLYDNAQLAMIYALAYEQTQRPLYRDVVTETLDYVLREMKDAGGGFYSALDAESEGVEGKFYRWKAEEIRQHLEDDASHALFAAAYGVEGPPNFEDEFYVLQTAQSWAEIAETHDVSYEELQERLRPLRAKLLRTRDERPRPLTDTKILTSWNGLMIRALADAGRILDEKQYIEAATQAADFLLNKMRTDDGRLLRSYSGGRAQLNAYLDDYAFFVDGLLALHQATEDPRWLQAARELTDKQLELFWDEENGGFFFTSDDHESLLARTKDPIDGAIPSGSSVSAENLLRLAEETDSARYRDLAEETIESALRGIGSAPAAAPRLMVVIARWLGND